MGKPVVPLLTEVKFFVVVVLFLFFLSNYLTDWQAIIDHHLIALSKLLPWCKGKIREKGGFLLSKDSVEESEGMKK